MTPYNCELVGGPWDGYTLHWDEKQQVSVLDIVDDATGKKAPVAGSPTVPNIFGKNAENELLLYVHSPFHGARNYIRSTDGRWYLVKEVPSEQGK